MVLEFQMKLFVVILFLALVAGGCTTKSKAKADARAAYLAGQNAVLSRQQMQQRTSIVVIGSVQNPEVEWVEGLTLAQAIATANYTGFREPKEIILTRRGEDGRINPKDLLHGADVPLEPGDTITIHE